MVEKDMPCAYWGEGGICAKFSEPDYTDFCVLGPCSHMVPSNADRIRAMSDEELAEFFFKDPFRMYMKTPKENLDWIKSPAEED